MWKIAASALAALGLFGAGVVWGDHWEQEPSEYDCPTEDSCTADYVTDRWVIREQASIEPATAVPGMPSYVG